MWDPPGPGIEPMSPALAGRFLTTEPPGNSLGANISAKSVGHCAASPLARSPSLAFSITPACLQLSGSSSRNLRSCPSCLLWGLRRSPPRAPLLGWGGGSPFSSLAPFSTKAASSSLGSGWAPPPEVSSSSSSPTGLPKGRVSCNPGPAPPLRSPPGPSSN